MALQPEPTWTGKYVLDFGKLALSDGDDTGNKTKDDGSDEEDPDRPMFSLVSGTYRQARRFGGGHDTEAAPASDADNPSAVVLRNQDSALTVLSDSAASKSITLIGLLVYARDSSQCLRRPILAGANVPRAGDARW